MEIRIFESNIKSNLIWYFWQCSSVKIKPFPLHTLFDNCLDQSPLLYLLNHFNHAFLNFGYCKTVQIPVFHLHRISKGVN